MLDERRSLKMHALDRLFSLIACLILSMLFCCSRLMSAVVFKHHNKSFRHMCHPLQDMQCNPWHDYTCELTDRPVIGILSQLVEPYKHISGPTYIAASYVKWVESGGGRVVPVTLHENATFYRNLLNKLNGFLIPGGDQNMTAGPFIDAVQHIYNASVALNRNGIYFPLWGTCLGFEFLSIAHANGRYWLSNCEAANVSLSLEYTTAAKKSRLFAHVPPEIYRNLAAKNITANYHHFCLTEENFKKQKMNKDYDILSYSREHAAGKFISTIEHKRFPIYGVQYHPEKANLEPSWKHNYNHGPDAVRASQFMAAFFVDEARKNNNRYESQAAEYDALIYNWNATFTGKTGGYFEQEYQFPK